MVEVFEIYHTRETKVDEDVEMLDARVTLLDIADRVQDTYNTNEGWVVKKMKLKHVNRIAVIFPLSIKKIRCNILAINFP